MRFVSRLAQLSDIPVLLPLIDSAIWELQRDVLPPDAIAASFEVMGLDTELITDGTYFVVCDNDQIVGCGGWSRRATLFGADHSPGRNATLLDPRSDAARVRAMYTAPAFARRGVGRLVLSLCEQSAATAGFTRLELAATRAGEPLYRACGFQRLETMVAQTSIGIPIPLLRMGKPLVAP